MHQELQLCSYLLSSNTQNGESGYFKQLHTCNRQAQILCKIAFDLDGQSQELLVYEYSTLEELTSQLISSLNKVCIDNQDEPLEFSQQDKRVLKEQIKNKIEDILSKNGEKTLHSAKWRCKLKDIISQKERTPMDSLISPSTKRIAVNENKPNSVSYFRYNYQNTCPSQQKDSQSKQVEIIQRMKLIDREINKELRPKENRFQRLYELGKQTDLIKQYLSKIHEHETIRQELSECTFHPSIRKIRLQNKEYENQNNGVFQRLYKQAQQKKEKMKRIQTEILHKQSEQMLNLKFIPQINQCSKQIVKAKKNKQQNIYQQLYTNPCKDTRRSQQQNSCFSKSQLLFKKRNNKKLPSKENNSKLFFDNSSKSNQDSTHTFQRSSLKTEQSSQKSPIVNKQKSRNKFQKYKLSLLSETNSKQLSQSETVKTINHKKIDFDTTQSTLKQNIIPKTKINKPQKGKSQKILHNKQFNFNKVKNNPKFFIDSKDIKRQKVIILEDTCPTQQAPLHRQQFGENISIMQHHSNYSEEKSKKNRLDPFTFFQSRQKETIKGVNKQNTKFPDTDKKLQLQFQRRKSKIFEDIFSYLLLYSKQRYEITYECFQRNLSIPDNLQPIFSPMAEQMKQLGVGLDRDEFIWSLARIFDTLTLQQRGWILGWGLKIQHPATSKNIR